MDKNTDNFKIVKATKPMLFALLGIVGIVVIVFLYIGRVHHTYVLDSFLLEEQKIASKIYANTIKRISKEYQKIAIDLLKNKDVIEAFENHSREKLLSLSEPIYKELIKENKYLYTMHFYTNETKSFLRLHKPKEHSDNLKPIRHMINKVNTDKIPYSGFEVGKHGAFYRVAVPVFNEDGKHLGVFDFGVDVNYILDIFNKDYGFKSILLLEKDIFNTIYEHNKNITYTAYSEAVLQNTNKSNMLFTIDSIKDISGSEIGKILFVKNLDFYTDKVENARNMSIFFALSIILFSYYLIRKILNNYINAMNSYQSKMEIKNRTLLKLSNMDHLTKISNRKSIETTLIKEIKRAQRYNIELSVIIFDIDNFKNVNDTYGHNVGDRVLKSVAKIVSASIRESDSFGRWGGEEFIIVSPETSIYQAEVVAQKVRKSINTHIFEDVKTITCSLGVAMYLEGNTHEDIVHNADTALYKAKHTGKDKVVTYKN